MQAVNNFKNETGYTKCARKLLQNAVPPPPRPQLVRPLPSRQQDPLLANAAHLSHTSAPSTTPPQTQAPTPVPAPTPPPAPSPEPEPAAPTPPHTATAVEGKDAVEHHSPPQSTNHGEPPPPG